MIEINLEQAKKLLEMFGGEEASITLQQEGDKIIAWYTEYPDEGIIMLNQVP